MVLDEVSQISAAVFERLLRIWEAAGNQPALVFIGDLRAAQGSRAPRRPGDSPFLEARSSNLSSALCGAAGAPLCVGSWSSCVLPSLRRSSSPIFSAGIAHLGAKNRQGYQAPSSPPSDDDIRAVFVEDPDTVFVHHHQGGRLLQ